MKPKIIILLIKIVKESISRKFSKKSTNSLSEFLSLGVLSEHSNEKDIITTESLEKISDNNYYNKIRKRIHQVLVLFTSGT